VPAARSSDILVRAARMYYLEGMSQSAVAVALGVSRSNVSRVLASAREQGVVEIRIHDPGSRFAADSTLADQLQQAFPVTRAVVVEPSRGVSAVEAVAFAAAEYVEEHLSDIHRLGLSWGSTVGKFVEAIEPKHLRADFAVVPLMGGMPTLDTRPAGNVTIQALARKCGVSAQRLYAPAVVESRQTHAALIRESAIAAALQRAAEVDFAVVGIGAAGVHSSRHILEAMRLSDDELRLVAASELGGDVCGRFVDVWGAPLGPPTSERVIGISFQQLLDLPRVLGMAAGQEKAQGVLSVLRSGVLDIVVLDATVAREVFARVNT